MPIKLKGSSSGDITLDVPATAGTNTLTLPAVTDTLTGIAATQTLTNKTLTSPTITSPTISGTPVMGASVITSGTAQASTSGTSINFTGIPSWVKRITVMFNGVSTNNTSDLLVQIGTSSGVEITGYTAAATRFGYTTLASASFTNGFGLNLSNAAETYSGSMIISNFTSNTWVAQGCFAVAAAGTVTFFNAGVKSLSAVLDRVRITSATPDTFDLGSINILYE